MNALMFKHSSVDHGAKKSARENLPMWALNYFDLCREKLKLYQSNNLSAEKYTQKSVDQNKWPRHWSFKQNFLLIHLSKDGVILQSKPDWQKFREVKEKIAVKFLKPDVGFKVINLDFS